MLSLLGYLILALLGTGVVWFGADRLEGAGNRLASYYGVPAIVQGAIIAAVGSSMPELATAVLAPVLHGDFELGLGVIIGSAIFNILVIPAVATLAQPGGLGATRQLVYKEAQFYLIAVAVFLLVLSLAVIYYPIEGDTLGGELTTPLALALLALYGLYVFIQYEDTIEYEAPVPSTAINPWRTWGSFIAGFVLILVGVEVLLRAAIGIGDLLGTPSFVWGLTIIAAATSLPDAFVSVRAAGANRSVTSIANVFGSNVFDLLVAVPAGVLVAGVATVDFERLTPIVGVLIVATVLLFTSLRTEYELTRVEAMVLLGVYGGFIVWVILAAIEVVPGPT